MKKHWEWAVAFTRDKKIPLLQNITNTLIHEIIQGRLPPGCRLPGTRTLAKQWGVSRNTMVQAYEELFSQGWTTTKRGQGTCVSSLLPFLQSHAFLPPSPRTLVSQTKSTKPEQLMWNDGFPDARLFPMNLLARTLGRLTRLHGTRLYNQPIVPQGSLRLRKSLAEMLRTKRGLHCQADELLVTRGSQQALFLIAQALKEKQRTSVGHIVVESPGYVPAAQAFRLAGFSVREAPVDAEGLCVDILASLCKQNHSPVAVYVTPHHQYPTTVTLRAHRRLQLLDLAHKHNFWVIEDDYDHDFCYDAAPLLPLAHMQWSNRLIYVGSLSKVVSVGLRLGYVTAPRELLKDMIQVRGWVDRMGDPLLEEAIAEMMEEGALQRHANKMRHLYHQRRDAFCEPLSQLLPALAFEKPTGGMAVWIPFPPGITYPAFSKALSSHQVIPLPPSHYWHGSVDTVPGTRIGFASLNEDEKNKTVQALASALP